MNRWSLFAGLALITGCLGNHPRPAPAGNRGADSTHPAYTDQSSAGIRLVSDSGGNWRYTATDVSYKVQSFSGNPFGDAFQSVHFGNDIEYFLEKFTTVTTASQGSEGQEREITVDIRPVRAPATDPVRFRQRCDRIRIGASCYTTIKYGCCGGDDACAVYNFRNELIAEGDGRIIAGCAPNSPIRFFAGFKNDNNDSLFIGTFHFGCNSMERYHIRLKPGRKLPVSCNYMAPEIFVASDGHVDFDKDNNEYTLWALDKIQNTASIGRVSIMLVFECTSEEKTDTITIPIVNGKPFGTGDPDRVLVAD